MLPWFRKASARSREARLPGGIGTVRFPEHFKVELETNDTLIAFDPEEDSITLRLSSVSLTPKEEGVSGAVQCIKDRGAENSLPVVEFANRAVISHEEAAAESGRDFLVRYWEIGIWNTIVILSATILQNGLQRRGVQRTLRLVPAIIQSLRLPCPADPEASEAELWLSAPEAGRTLTPDETAWLRASLREARMLARKYGLAGPLQPRLLDHLLDTWRDDPRPKEPAELVIDAVAAAFGEYLRDKHAFEWCLLGAPEAPAVGVRHSISATNLLLQKLVHNRIVRGQGPNLEAAHARLLAEIGRH